MNAIIKHAGLQIVEKDVEDFYIDVMGCQIVSTSYLSKEDAGQIFDIHQEVKILFTICAEMDIELFIADTPRTLTFSHICIHVSSATELVDKARQKGYRVFARKRENSETYFVRDSNFNVFEIKKMGDL